MATTIRTQRHEIEKLLDDSPSLRRASAEAAEESYGVARRNASAKTGLPLDAFPPTCPFDLDRILAEGWLP